MPLCKSPGASHCQTAVSYTHLDVYKRQDFLPGLVVDKFGDGLAIQTLSLGMDQRKDMLARLLCEITGATGVYERNDVPVCRHEGLRCV